MKQLKTVRSIGFGTKTLNVAVQRNQLDTRKVSVHLALDRFANGWASSAKTKPQKYFGYGKISFQLVQ